MFLAACFTRHQATKPPQLFLDPHVQTGYHPAHWGPPGALTNHFHAILKTLVDLCANSEIALSAIFHNAPYLCNRVDLDAAEWN